MNRLIGCTVKILVLGLASGTDAGETFVDKSATLGLKLQSRRTIAAGVHGAGLAIRSGWVDSDNDGDVDVFIRAVSSGDHARLLRKLRLWSGEVPLVVTWSALSDFSTHATMSN
ncbi:MAG: hypothetical protein CMJ75_06630 [Planctomycetaceae bacterium]|nr:hypothetical protein [Planctomycetaceae bacterium]